MMDLLHVSIKNSLKVAFNHIKLFNVAPTNSLLITIFLRVKVSRMKNRGPPAAMKIWLLMTTTCQSTVKNNL